MSLWTPAAALAASGDEPTIAPGQRPWPRSQRLLRRVWIWIAERRAIQARSRRRLVVTETVSLGEKRFLSLITLDDTQFLIGGSPSQVTLLAHMDQAQPGPAAFAGVLEQQQRRAEQSR